MSILNITEEAYSRLLQIFAKKPQGAILRISVEGGGCAGFQYKYEVQNILDINNDDILIKKEEITIVTDTCSAALLENSTLDYSQNMMASQFEIINPNSTSRCGCGNSFSV